MSVRTFMCTHSSKAQGSSSCLRPPLAQIRAFQGAYRRCTENERTVCDSQRVALSWTLRLVFGRYMAPEVYKREPYDGRQADIWAAGVMFFVSVFGRFPWRAPFTNFVRTM